MENRASMTITRWLAAVAALVTISIVAPPARVVAQDVAATASVVDGVFTSDQADRGKKEFQQICSACHTVAEHTGKNFESRWNGSTVGDVFDLVSNTMPESDPGGLKPDEYASILAFFLRESGFKDGAKELPSDLELLKKIRIETLSK
jgi:mono/diheme cytochrome c family protein